MSLHRWFCLSAYLTLGLSCAALVFAEAPFLPDLQICLAPVLALLLLAWWVEGRWRLPNWGANILGALIAAGGAAWLATQMTEEDSLLMRVPLHLALLPYMGPLLMAALLVKVFGTRGSGDFWRLQGLGLMQIGLGCVLDGGPVFGGLMAAYFASALACLALRYRLSILDHRPAPSAWWLLAFLPRWTLLIVGPALLLFLLTPRRDSSAWSPLNSFRSGNQSGHAQGGDEINLNGAGHIDLDDRIALHVIALDAAGQRKRDLPDDQYWRGAVLDWYDKGKWMARGQIPIDPRRGGQRHLPDFGAGQFFLLFTVPLHQSGSRALAEPIRFGPPTARLPVETLSGNGRPHLFNEQSGTVLPQQVSGKQAYQYRQVVPAQPDPSRTFAEREPPGAYLERLTHQPVSGLQEWTIDLLRRLSEQPHCRLPAGVRAALAKPRPSFLLDCDDWEATARALTDYLANAGEFTYTLDITRRDPSLDPVMDFLVNVKQGHCELYATALALMLRSLGIPARVVKGFHGFDRQGDGVYWVRRRHAHAWVEILVPHNLSRPPSFDWLTLDPTPAESAATVRRFSLNHLWEEIQRMGLQSWQSLIVEYNAENQADLWDTLRSGRPLSLLLKLGLAVAASLAVWLIPRRLSRRRRTAEVRGSDAALYYLRLVRLLGRHALLRPSLAQTPREYGETARTFLRTRPALAALAELPIRVVEQFYRVRFGGQPLSEGERQALDAELERFAAAIRAERRPSR